MRKTLITAGWLVMAAALTMGMTACSSEDNVIEEQQPQQPEQQPTQAVGKVHVTVGAGIDSNTTRSAVVNENGTRTLTFTTGDRLYVYGYISDEGGSEQKQAPKATTRRGGGSKTLAGYLAIDGTPEAGATTATFSGDLTVWVSGEEPSEYVESSYDFTTEDPLGECSTVRAILVHKDAGESFVVGPEKNGYYENGNLAATVDALMTTSFNIEGTYDSENKRFPLAIDDEYSSTPIFNCTVTGGLTANAKYEVTLLSGADASSVGEYGGSMGTVTANSSGGVSFACTSKVSKESRYYAIRFKNTTVDDDWKRISLGTKALDSKVYNISRAASADPDAPAIPTITGATYTTPNENGFSWIDGNGGALTFSIAGTSRGVSFQMENYTSATVTLSNLDAKFYNTFLGGENDITIVLDGNSTISVRDGGACIFVAYNVYVERYSNLKLKGNGTLTVTVGNDPLCGLCGYNYNEENNNNSTTTEVDVTTQLAATGYTVTRSARSESGGKYTWTYTVAPKPAN